MVKINRRKARPSFINAEKIKNAEVFSESIHVSVAGHSRIRSFVSAYRLSGGNCRLSPQLPSHIIFLLVRSELQSAVCLRRIFSFFIISIFRSVAIQRRTSNRTLQTKTQKKNSWNMGIRYFCKERALNIINIPRKVADVYFTRLRFVCAPVPTDQVEHKPYKRRSTHEWISFCLLCFVLVVVLCVVIVVISTFRGIGSGRNSYARWYSR